MIAAPIGQGKSRPHHATDASPRASASTGSGAL